MKILIVDDEALARERLSGLISEIDSSAILIEAEHGLAALDAVQRQPPDIVLLDIRMPLMDGLEVAHHLANLESPPAVIFTTAYQDHALEAFDIHAVDYLLKPIRKQRLIDALQRARTLRRGNINEIRSQDNLNAARSHLSAIKQGDIQLIPVNDIRYLKADQKYIVAAWPGGQILLDESLKSLESEFHSIFIRIHRNALVASQYIEGLKKDKEGYLSIQLRNMTDTLRISRRHLSSIRQAIKKLGK
jgi:two-component system response regulator AlgR